MLYQTKKLIEMSNAGPLEMTFVLDWLNSQKAVFERIEKIQNALAAFNATEGVMRLPHKFENTSEDIEFLDIYKQLRKLRGFYDKEEFFKSKIQELMNISNDSGLLQSFYLKNLWLYEEHIFKFFIEYYDDENSECLQVSLLSDNPSIRISPKSFYYTITFSDVFENTFSNQ